MELGPGSYGLGFLAGVLSILSPCVLPLLPIVVGTAVAAHPLGTLALSLGLALSFTGVGLFVATIGFAIGLDAEWFRNIAAMLLIGFGVILLSGSLQQRFAGATAALGTYGDQWLRRLRIEGMGGQLVVGLLLGLVWAPCRFREFERGLKRPGQGRGVQRMRLGPCGPSRFHLPGVHQET